MAPARRRVPRGLVFSLLLSRAYAASPSTAIAEAIPANNQRLAAVAATAAAVSIRSC